MPQKCPSLECRHVGVDGEGRHGGGDQKLAHPSIQQYGLGSVTFLVFLKSNVEPKENIQKHKN